MGLLFLRQGPVFRYQRKAGVTDREALLEVHEETGPKIFQLFHGGEYNVLRHVRLNESVLIRVTNKDGVTHI